MGVIAATLFIRTHIHNKTFTDANLIAGFLFFTMVQLYFGMHAHSRSHTDFADVLAIGEQA